MSWKLILRIGMFVVAIAGFMGLKHYRKSQSSDQLKGHMVKNLAQLQGYQENKEYIHGLFDKAHPAAFEAAFSSKFNEELYVKKLYESMISAAQKDDKKMLAMNMKLQLILFEESLNKRKAGTAPVPEKSNQKDTPKKE